MADWSVFFVILLLVLHVPWGPAELVLALPFYFCLFLVFFSIREIVATSGHIQNKQHSCTECVESKERHKVDWINAYIADKKEAMLFLREMEEHRLLS